MYIAMVFNRKPEECNMGRFTRFSIKKAKNSNVHGNHQAYGQDLPPCSSNIDLPIWNRGSLHKMLLKMEVQHPLQRNPNNTRCRTLQHPLSTTQLYMVRHREHPHRRKLGFLHRMQIQVDANHGHDATTVINMQIRPH